MENESYEKVNMLGWIKAYCLWALRKFETCSLDERMKIKNEISNLDVIVCYTFPSCICNKYLKMTKFKKLNLEKNYDFSNKDMSSFLAGYCKWARKQIVDNTFEKDCKLKYELGCMHYMLSESTKAKSFYDYLQERAYYDKDSRNDSEPIEITISKGRKIL